MQRRGALRRIGLGLGAGASVGLAGCTRRADPRGPLEFWAMGREAEVVAELLPPFRQRHPGIDVRIQQMPWTAAHEKLLTAYAGDVLPDLCQLGNTWIPEFSALDALEPLDDRVAASSATSGINRDDYFSGILDTNLMPAGDGRNVLRNLKALLICKLFDFDVVGLDLGLDHCAIRIRVLRLYRSDRLRVATRAAH